jgi:hypothetical protein
MTNGFTTPDPNTPPDSEAGNDATDDEQVTVIPQEGELLEMIDDDVSCENCIHYRTCALIAGFRQMTDEWGAGGEEDDAPIDATDFAAICDEFELPPDFDPGDGF